MSIAYRVPTITCRFQDVKNSQLRFSLQNLHFKPFQKIKEGMQFFLSQRASDDKNLHFHLSKSIKTL